MREKELIKKWKELKKIIEENENKFTSKIEASEQSSKSKGQIYGGRTKTIGTHPSTGNFYKVSKDPENHKGYASALLLGLLTFVFQILFISIVYIIIK